MGLQISEIIERKEITIEHLQGKIIAVDAFNTIYQFLTTIRQLDGTPLMDSRGNITSHLSGLFYRTTNLMSKGLKLVFVFDGKPPELKGTTTEKRENVKEEARKKYEEAKAKGDKEEMGKYARQITYLTDEMIKESKELIDALGLTSIQASGEGEAQAAFIANKGDAYAVASQDYDSLLFGAPYLIQNLTLSRKRKLASGASVTIQPELIELKHVLKSLDITQEQLICLGILVGTDYNPGGVKGIGQKTALQIVKQNKNPEKIFKEVSKEPKYEINFDWHEIFKLFEKPNIIKNYKIEFKQINEEKLRNLLVKKHEFSEERLNSALEKLKEHKDSMKQKALNKWF